MTPEEIERLEIELAEAEQMHNQEFEKWYDTARLTTVKDHCRTGWLLWRLIDEDRRTDTQG